MTLLTTNVTYILLWDQISTLLQLIQWMLIQKNPEIKYNLKYRVKKAYNSITINSLSKQLHSTLLMLWLEHARCTTRTELL